MRLFIFSSRRLLSIVLTSMTLAAPTAWAGKDCPSCGVSDASQALSSASATVITGSIKAIAASGKLSVKSVEALGETTVIVLKGASETAVGSVRLSAKLAKGASLAVGTVIEVTVMSTGYLLVASGKAVAFIPNEVGKTLLHQSRIEKRI